jgi:hypothetical protein
MRQVRQGEVGDAAGWQGVMIFATLVSLAFFFGGALGFWAGRQITMAQIYNMLEHPEDRQVCGEIVRERTQDG